ncbi:helix-turn-helix domain-containing protein [Tenuibacillus multivorans]|uniref:helix-turn-helix domain-containing protein n=1 Tax=Tenuibacillus multivorans TaxID=237069 RepID=UPI000B809034|nr:helix-turn-helix domain-containing protein [Tenuibacillus multivorans]GEL76725.1 hypothetical protein TMU01_09600 [Tenuibacillus multivorans]
MIRPDRLHESKSIITKKKVDQDPSYLVTYKLFQNGALIEDIAKERDYTISTIEKHLLKAHKNGYEVNWDLLFTGEAKEIILNQIPDEPDIKLKPIKEQLPDEISYSMIKAVLAKHEII